MVPRSARLTMNGRFPLRTFTPPMPELPYRVRPRLDVRQAYERASQLTNVLLAEYERVMRLFSPSWPAPGKLNFENPAADPAQLEDLAGRLEGAGFQERGYHLRSLASQVRAYRAKRYATQAPGGGPIVGANGVMSVLKSFATPPDALVQAAWNDKNLLTEVAKFLEAQAKSNDAATRRWVFVVNRILARRLRTLEEPI